MNTSPSRHPAVHPPRHLQDLVGAEIQAMQHVAAALDHVAVAGVVDHHGVESADVERRLPGRGHREQEGVLRLAFEKRTDDPDRLAAVVERRVEPGPPLAQLPGELLHLRPGGHEHRDPTLLLDDVADELVVEELLSALLDHLDLRPEAGSNAEVSSTRRGLEVAGVEGGIHGGAEPDEPAAGPLAQRQAELELGRGLVDLVDDEGVASGDEIVLEPAAGDSGRHDHHVPAGRLRRGLALPVDHPDPERLPQDRLRDRPDAERLAGAGAGHDAEALADPPARRTSAPCSRSSTVSIPDSPRASSIVSQAARVGAMTMTRPRG